MSKEENLKIRPYARLLTMLGDQLIKDETIALIELVKNAYDADAEHVKISFQNFNADNTSNEQSKIIIEDDGNGMNDTILKEAWMNPATPEKLKRKREKNTTDKGRIMQGEKGIGRFAIFKIGSKSDIITRRQKRIKGNFIDESGVAEEREYFIDAPESDNEYVLEYDFSDYDSDFLTKGEEEKEIFLDELTVKLTEREAVDITACPITYGSATPTTRKCYGTRIVISNLNTVWNKNKIEKVYQNVIRMQPIFGENENNEEKFVKDFSVYLDVNGIIYIPESKSIEELQQTLNYKSVFVVDGNFCADEKTINYIIDNHTETKEYHFKLNHPEMLGISQMRDFLNSLDQRETECGSFSYKFYIFDLDISLKSPDTRFYLDPEEKKNIKAHRIYLYRDGIRVMPYGDPEDDWLRLDTIRGIESAGHIFGNDQIIGYIKISQKDNPKLRDKTNREGLVEDGHAREDLVNINQLILRYIRTKPYSQYLIDKKKKIEKRDDTTNKPLSIITKAREERIGEKAVKEALNNIDSFKVNDIPSENIAAGQKVVDNFLDNLEKSYRKEVDVLESRINTTENLAAIGLSAETAYHDARIILQRVNNELGIIIKNYREQSENYLDKSSVIKDLNPIKTQLTNVTNLMNDIQKLFPSTKRQKSSINVQQVIVMVQKLYAESLKRANIDCVINSISEQPLIVECTDAVLLQVFINLFDNALYWLQTVGRNRQILIEINAVERTVIFADSGPGVRPDDSPYIFEAFYSGKGEDGKGLGLYIARQLLGRYNSSIELISDERSKLLSGANFLVKFENEEP